MRKIWHALLVAAFAAGVLAAGARADSWRDEASGVQRSSGETRPGVPETVAQKSVLYASVTKPFGAAVRVFPSSDAAIMLSARCGEVWSVLAVDRGWVKVLTEAGAGWVGGSRVVVSGAPATVDCADARHIHLMGYVATSVATGCLSLRSRPSSDAPVLACVENGHRYAVLDGPFEPGSGDDWFRVTSPSTGSGWALAEHLFPV